MSKLTLIEQDALRAVAAGALVEVGVKEIQQLQRQGLVQLVALPTMRGLRVLREGELPPVALKAEEALKLVQA